MIFKDKSFVLTQYGFKPVEDLTLTEGYELAYLKDNEIKYTKDFEIVESIPDEYTKISTTKFTNIIFDNLGLYDNGNIDLKSLVEANKTLGLIKSGDFTDCGINTQPYTIEYLKNNLKIKIAIKLEDLLTLIILFNKYGSITNDFVVLRIHNEDIFKETVKFFKNISNYNGQNDLMPYVSYKENYISMNSEDLRKIFIKRDVFLQYIFKDLDKKSTFEALLKSFIVIKDEILNIFTFVDLNLTSALFISALAIYNNFKVKLRIIRDGSKICVKLVEGNKERIKPKQITFGKNSRKSLFYGVQLKDEGGYIITANQVGKYLGITIVSNYKENIIQLDDILS